MTASFTVLTPAVIDRARILLISGAEHDDRTSRMLDLSRELLQAEGMEVDLLDPATAHPSDVYEKWLFAHGVMVIAPAASSAIEDRFKAAIDRMASAGYPHRLADRAYGVVVHGETQAAEESRRALTDWFDQMDMVDSDTYAILDRYVGYHESFTGDEQQKAEEDIQAEVRNVARAVANAVSDLRAGRLTPPERRARRTA
jgi:multimeric flavodoxin WrbA